jgi:NAD(P)-dependent dehydrogenase (short-subunit alcohol dehydrogenase family)
MSSAAERNARAGSGLAGAAALAVGAALGAAAAAGNALLLYTGHGFLRAAGLLVSSTVMAVAAGVWAGAPDPDDRRPVRTRGRWLALVVALLLGGAFTALWTARLPLRELAAGGALAVLFVLALPGYCAGALLAGLHAREREPLRCAASGSVGPAALAGTAFGVLIAATVLIQTLEPYGIYYAAAGALTLVALLEWNRASAAATRTEADMRGYVVVVTGVGHRGQVGFALARAFLDAGARVVISDARPAVEQLAAELGDEDRVHAVQADLTVDDDVARLVGTASQRFGRLDVLINVAGGLSVTKPVADTTPEEWRREVQRNAETVLRCSRAALPLLREAGGAIINFASPAGLRAAAGLGAYSAAKAAVVALTRALALEERANGVRVNAIAPGIIDTEQNRRDLGDDAAFVTRADVASVALFLAGPGAAGISGETIQVLGRTLDA